MKIYFLSSQPCALTVNDAYFGLTDRFERFAELSLKDNLFIRFSPENALPIAFFLNENVRFQAPTGCEVYRLPDGLAVYARDFPPNDFSLKIINQARFGNNLVTVFKQGEVQAAFETEKGSFVAALPPSFIDCKLSFHNSFFFIENQNMLTVYALNGERVFCERFLDYSIEENTFNATLPLSDSLQRRANCTYLLSEDGFTQTQFSISQSRSYHNETDPSVIQNELLPFVFFESVLIGANYAKFLSDELIPNADKIRAFLGDFIAVTPTENPNVCGIVKKIGERLFEVIHYTVAIENGKIFDITT